MHEAAGEAAVGGGVFVEVAELLHAAVMNDAAVAVVGFETTTCLGKEPGVRGQASWMRSCYLMMKVVVVGYRSLSQVLVGLPWGEGIAQQKIDSGLVAG